MKPFKWVTVVAVASFNPSTYDRVLALGMAALALANALVFQLSALSHDPP